MASILIHTADESVTLTAQAVKRLLERGDGDAALLYLALLRHHGNVQPRSLAGELRWDRSRIEAAELALRELRLLAPAAEEVPYDIGLTYWIASSDQKSAGTIQAQVEAAVDAYESWQRKMGRDINPTELVYRVRAAGAKRVKLTAPEDIVIEKTQLPKRNTRTVTYGGLEDD